MQCVWEGIRYVNEVQLMKSSLTGPVSEVQLVIGLWPIQFTFLFLGEWGAFQKSSERDQHMKSYVLEVWA